MSQYKFKINGKEFDVTVNSVEGKNAAVNVNGVDYNVELAEPVASPAIGGEHIVSPANGGVEHSETVSGAKPSAVATGAGKKIVSPLPGVIIDICVNVGDSVKRGQKIAVIEAMKMENDILAESDGSITAIYVKKSDSVLEGADIASIA